MAKVDHASVRQAGTGKYGQASSGSLTLTGRLGVFRIIKDESETPVKDKVTRGKGGSANGRLESEERAVIASWDTQELSERFGHSDKRYTRLQRYSAYGAGNIAGGDVNPLDVFFVPVRIMDADPDGRDYEQPMLTGLLLLPTGNKKGVFRRVGQFELALDWMDSQREEGFEYFSKSTAILDNRYYVSKRWWKYTICIV
jgi:hypothetical protein